VICSILDPPPRLYLYYSIQAVFIEMIKTDLFLFAGDAAQSDDITMIAIR
jgi:hypothetical protein